MTDSVFDKKHVYLDEVKFRELLDKKRRELERLPQSNSVQSHLTQGRTSGLYLALSYLEECVVRPKEQNESR